jgi:EAL domain-containing protein (putative c-di-GMP-specific phosphodiesterase class I)
VATAQELGLADGALAIEITEGLLLEGDSEVNRQLETLRQGGFLVSLDDFGTGFSSLSYLHQYAIDLLKIDQRFVRNLRPGTKDLALCKAIITMAHELGLQVVAEGVETQEQFELLRSAGCDYGQGYLFARPLPAEAFEQLLRQGKA